MEERAPRVLLVEDDARIGELVSSYLASHGFEAAVQDTGTGAVERILSETPDVVILDWMLPGEDGLGICARLRARGYGGRVLMLTARAEEVDQIVGLEVGADDYLAKPLRPRLLLARLRALLRRGRGAPAEALRIGDLEVDRGRRRVTVAGAVVGLTTAEFDLLWLLAQRRGEPVDRETLFRELRGIDYDGLDRAMDMRVLQVRRRLQRADPSGRDWILTVRGVGYQLVRA